VDNFWSDFNIPIQDIDESMESINPAEAYRRQAIVVNKSAPLYAELEEKEEQLTKYKKLEKELRSRVLSQNMPVPSSSTRTNDLVDAFIISCSKKYVNSEGEETDVSENLLELSRNIITLEADITKLERRIRALESMADKCDRILNWQKFMGKVEIGRI
jgi:chromosome segregation ATPase